jgi:membrane protease YdiL (CAAX protease family)
MSLAPPSLPPPGWYADPWRLAPLRWWDGRAWSWHVYGIATDGAPGAARPLTRPYGPVTSPGPATPQRLSAPMVPIEAGLWGLVAITVLMVGLGLVASVVATHLPVIPAVILVTAALYGPMAWYCLYASRRWATGHLDVDYGLRFRPVDLAIGVAAAVGAVQVERILFAIIDALGVPVTSNTSALDHTSDRALYVTLAAVAVVAAPVVEELFFRGLLLSALRSRLSVPMAITVQAVLFGAYHAAPVYGWGNVGLVIILAGVGATFGVTAQLTRRLGPGMVAHALLNAVVFAVLLAS